MDDLVHHTDHGCQCTVIVGRHHYLLSAPFSAAAFAVAARSRWGIEDRLHGTGDVTLGEDCSLIHTGVGPTVMCLLRDTAIARRLRIHADAPATALPLALCLPPTRA